MSNTAASSRRVRLVRRLVQTTVRRRSSDDAQGRPRLGWVLRSRRWSSRKTELGRPVIEPARCTTTCVHAWSFATRFQLRSRDGKTSRPSQPRIPPAMDRSSRRRGGHLTLPGGVVGWLGESRARRRVQPWMRLARRARPRQSVRGCEPDCSVMGSRTRSHAGTALRTLRSCRRAPRRAGTRAGHARARPTA